MKPFGLRHTRANVARAVAIPEANIVDASWNIGVVIILSQSATAYFASNVIERLGEPQSIGHTSETDLRISGR